MAVDLLLQICRKRRCSEVKALTVLRCELLSVKTKMKNEGEISNIRWTQVNFGQVPLVEWCLKTVVHSKESVVEVINNTHDLNYLGK